MLIEPVDMVVVPQQRHAISRSEESFGVADAQNEKHGTADSVGALLLLRAATITMYLVRSRAIRGRPIRSMR